MDDAGRTKEELRKEIAQKSVEEINEIPGHGLGRDFQDFLLGRQHGWDRASGTSGIGTADRMG